MILRKFVKWFLPLAVSLTGSVMMTGCSDENQEFEPEPIPGPGQSAGSGGRSVLVYMLSDNSLGTDGYDRENLADMIQAARDGVFGSRRLIVYHDDRMAEAPILKEVTPMGLRILKEYDNKLSSVASARMEQVIADFKSVASSGKYGLILWSHATGWLQTGMPDDGATPQWIGEDWGKYMNVTTLARVLEGKGFDYIYFDCCHMASVEALYELRNVADEFVGSCAELPAEGMPYRETLPFLMAEDADLVGAARVTFDKYNCMTGSSRTATMSVVDASGLDRLAEATRSVYSLHPQLPVGYSGQPFERPKINGEPCYMFDFEDYVTALYSSSSDREMRRAYADWLIALDDCVTYQASTPYIFNTIRVDIHCGLSTYILRDAADARVKNYWQLSWYSNVVSALFN